MMGVWDSSPKPHRRTRFTSLRLTPSRGLGRSVVERRITTARDHPAQISARQGSPSRSRGAAPQWVRKNLLCDVERPLGRARSMVQITRRAFLEVGVAAVLAGL